MWFTNMINIASFPHVLFATVSYITTHQTSMTGTLKRHRPLDPLVPGDPSWLPNPKRSKRFSKSSSSLASRRSWRDVKRRRSEREAYIECILNVMFTVYYQLIANSFLVVDTWRTWKILVWFIHATRAGFDPSLLWKSIYTVLQSYTCYFHKTIYIYLSLSVEMLNTNH